MMFCLLAPTEAIKVYEFHEGNSTISDISYVTMNLNVSSVAKKVTICSTHKQMQSNLNTTTLYTIYEDKKFTKPWFLLGFWGESLWAQENLGIWHLLGTLHKKTDFISWINMCIEIDFKERKFSVSLNGHNASSAETRLKSLKKIGTFYIRYLYLIFNLEMFN